MPDDYPQERMPIPEKGITIIRKRLEPYAVWRQGGLIYKQQPKYLTDNEYGFLKVLEDKPYTPNWYS